MPLFGSTGHLDTPLVQLCQLLSSTIPDDFRNFLTKYFIITLPAILVAIVSILSIINTSIPSFTKLLWAQKNFISGMTLEIVSILFTDDLYRRLDFLQREHDLVHIYMDLCWSKFHIMILITTSMFGGLFLFGLIKNQESLAGIILDLWGGFITLFSFCVYSAIEYVSWRSTSLMSSIIFASLTVEGAGLLRGISVFTEIGRITTPIVRAVSIKIGELMKWIFNLMLKLFKWIYKLILRICYCIYSVCIFIGEKVIWPICQYIYNVCEAIIKFIRNPPPPPQFLVDFAVNIFLSVVSFFRFLKRCFVTSAQFLHKCFVMIYEFLVWIVNKLYLISVSIYSNILLPIYHGVILCLVALYNFLALVVRRLFDFLNLLYNLFIQFSVSIY